MSHKEIVGFKAFNNIVAIQVRSHREVNGKRLQQAMLRYNRANGMIHHRIVSVYRGG